MRIPVTDSAFASAELHSKKAPPLGGASLWIAQEERPCFPADITKSGPARFRHSTPTIKEEPRRNAAIGKGGSHRSLGSGRPSMGPPRKLFSKTLSCYCTKSNKSYNSTSQFVLGSRPLSDHLLTPSIMSPMRWAATCMLPGTALLPLVIPKGRPDRPLSNVATAHRHD